MLSHAAAAWKTRLPRLRLMMTRPLHLTSTLGKDNPDYVALKNREKKRKEDR